MNVRDDFPLLNKDYIYFDNGATTLKPKCVIESISDYYTNYPANAHRGDYDLSLKVSSKYEETRESVRKFINAKNTSEIIFTSGATEGLNEVIFGYLGEYLKSNDEIITTKSEHASIVLPLFELEKEKNIKVKFAPLTEDYTLTVDNVLSTVTNNTKAIVISHITNVIGDIRPIKEIISEMHKRNIICIIDASQSVGHTLVDVEKLDADFLVFSAHKMLGPTGVGVLYGKYEYLNRVKPLKYGGGMNISYNSSSDIKYKELPYKLEAGTQNISGVIGFNEAIKYINNIGLENIENITKSLKKYLIENLEKNNKIKIYNKNIEGYTVTFNVTDVFAQDVSIYLNKYNIMVRSGSHCAKKLVDEIGVSNTCRISLYFYNTKEEIDKLVKVLENDNILEESIGV